MAQQTTPLWDALMQFRDAERERVSKSTIVAHEDESPVELTPMGIIRWYTHPSLDQQAMKTYNLWIQEIPPGSRSGRVTHQGGRLHYVWQGQGYTVVNGVSHEWETGDLILIPVVTEGVEFQHFNTGDTLAKLVTVELNLSSFASIDFGVRFEVVEPAPEYRASR